MTLLKQVAWIGSSRSDLMDMPPEVQDDLGYGLHQAQAGCFPDYAKPLQGFNGVIEIVCNFDKNTFRAVYAAKLGQQIFVLHVFQKKSKSGVKTPKEDLEVIKQRLKTAKKLLNNMRGAQ